MLRSVLIPVAFLFSGTAFSQTRSISECGLAPAVKDPSGKYVLQSPAYYEQFLLCPEYYSRNGTNYKTRNQWNVLFHHYRESLEQSGGDLQARFTYGLKGAENPAGEIVIHQPVSRLHEEVVHQPVIARINTNSLEYLERQAIEERAFYSELGRVREIEPANAQERKQKRKALTAFGNGVFPGRYDDVYATISVTRHEGTNAFQVNVIWELWQENENDGGSSPGAVALGGISFQHSSDDLSPAWGYLKPLSVQALMRLSIQSDPAEGDPATAGNSGRLMARTIFAISQIENAMELSSRPR